MNGFTDKHKSFTTGATALTANVVVKLSSGLLVVAGAGEDSVGVTMVASAIGAQCAVKLWNDSGTFLVTAAAAYATELDVYPAAAGKVSTTVSGKSLGRLAELASADGDLVEISKVSGSGEAATVAHISDPAAMANPTTSGTAVPTDYTAPTAAQSTPVTSNAATDLDDAAAALATLVDEVTAMEVELSAAVADIAAAKTAVDLNNGVIDSILAALEGAGIVAAS